MYSNIHVQNNFFLPLDHCYDLRDDILVGNINSDEQKVYGIGRDMT